MYGNEEAFLPFGTSIFPSLDTSRDMLLMRRCSLYLKITDLEQVLAYEQED